MLFALVGGSSFFFYFAIIVAALVSAILYVYVERCFSFWTQRGVQQVEPTVFFFGNFTDVLFRRRTFGDEIKNIYQKYRDQGLDYVGAYFFTQPVLIPLDPDLIKRILTKDFDHFADRGIYVNEKNDPLFAHLFSLPEDRWRRLRHKLTPTFTSTKMKTMFHTLMDSANSLCKVVEEQCDVAEIKDLSARYTTDVIGSCAFGIECNSLRDPETDFRKYGRKFFHPTDPVQQLKFNCTMMFPKIMEFFGARTVHPEISAFFMGVVKDTMDYRQKNRIHRNDFMQLLLQLHKGEDKDKLTVEQIAAQCFLFFIAGFETASTCLAFCMYELAKDARMQAKLRKEIATVAKKHDGLVTYEGVTVDMKYMDMVVNEALRKYPPVPTVVRVCTKEYLVPGTKVVIAEGQRVLVPVTGLHGYAAYYPEPERFLDGEKALRHMYTFLPFAEGPRNCIGLKFALMEIKVALAVLLSNFRFSVNERTDQPLRMNPKSIVSSSQGGIYLNVEKI